MKAMTKQEKDKVRGWCASWYTLERKQCTLAEWIALKLSVDQRTAARYAAWLENDRKARGGEV